ncbi:MAG: type II toxin-antitoxin system PemK/MazF family toxin [Rhodocyclaceae bacterium]|nr:type II toxin-antitoxin system PemK/MazF family toxin [Rhodocyclaceae bacterium]
MTYERFDVVVVPFPFTDSSASKRRPAVVISHETAFNAPAGHSVMAMITSAGNAPWPLDRPVQDISSAGLSAPSVVRMKLLRWTTASCCAGPASCPVGTGKRLRQR